MAEISFLTEADRAGWEVLARGKDTYFEVERGDDDYERTWRRLLDEWVARDAEEQGFPSLYWNTLEDAPARALYDKVGEYRQGFIHYAYRRAPR